LAGAGPQVKAARAVDSRKHYLRIIINLCIQFFDGLFKQISMNSAARVVQRQWASAIFRVQYRCLQALPRLVIKIAKAICSPTSDPFPSLNSGIRFRLNLKKTAAFQSVRLNFGHY
jgi:hypothetical protein